MDLERFIANRELLERLSREYELLKASGADVDFAAWVQQRLREAAAELAAATAVVDARSGDTQHSDNYGNVAEGAQRSTAASEQGAFTGEAAAGGSLVATPAEQLAFTRRPGPAAAPIPMSRPMLEGAPTGAGRRETAWFLRGEGTGPASDALASTIQGPSNEGTHIAAPPLLRAAKTCRSKSSKRVVIISPRKSPLQPPQRPRPKQEPSLQQQQHSGPPPPVSKLYTHVEPGLFSARPDTYVHLQGRARSTPSAAMRPDWVNAASLQAALREASSAVPHLQAAAERERRLALSTALVRQTLAAGLGQDDARAVALTGGVGPVSAAAQAAEVDHVLLVAHQLAQQNEQLALAVQLNSAQLAQQQALLASLQQQPQQHSGPATPAAGGSAGAGARVEVESGPPPWFTRRGPPGPAVASHRERAGVSLVPKAAYSHAATSLSTGKSPKKAAARSRSPPLHAAGAIGPAMTTKAAAATAVATTAKERERSSRKDALKALLKQVLGGAGLAGGREGRRRLASSMAEAEKLVAAIQALARTKAKDGMAVGQHQTTQTLEAIKALAVDETQTSSGRASAFGDDGGAAAAAVAQSNVSRQPSKAASRAGSHSTASAVDAASAGAAPGSGSLALSRQGSGPVNGSDGGEEQFLVNAGGAPGAAFRASESSGDYEEPGSGEPSRAASKKSVSAQGSAKYTIAPSSTTTTTTTSYPPSPALETTKRTVSLASSAGGQRNQRAPASDGSAPAPTPGAAAAPGGGSIASGPAGVAGARAHVPESAATTTGGVGRSNPLPLRGLLVESLEDEVQQIVERDAAAAAEMSRLQKLDTLEQRLHSMVDRVESRLARVLQPMQLNEQQLQQQAGFMGKATWAPAAAAAQTAWARAPPGADAGVAANRTTAGDAPLAAVAAAVAAAAAAGVGSRTAHGEVTGAVIVAPGGFGAAGAGGGGGGGGGNTIGIDIVSPRSAGLSVLELQRMLIELNRMESKEQEVRRKWFFDTGSHRQRCTVAQPIVVRDGQLGTFDPNDAAAAAAPSPPFSPPSHRVASPNPRHWSPPRPPTESVFATVTLNTIRSALSGPSAALSLGPRRGTAAGGVDAFSVQAKDGTAEVDKALADPISDATLQSVLRARRRFLRAQQLADGDLLVVADPSLNPVQIMEDLADALLQELLHEQAQELTALCDSLGEHMLKDELDLSSDNDDGNGRR